MYADLVVNQYTDVYSKLNKKAPRDHWEGVSGMGEVPFITYTEIVF